MHKFLQITFILILAASLSSTTHAQTSWTGIPAFSTQLVSETDSINPANLNVHVVMPNFSKPGRGLSLNNVFSYDSLVWVIQNDGYPNYTVHWLPPSGNITISAAGIFGRVAWTHTTGICGPSTNGQNQSNSNYIYYDPFGASHYFPNSSVAIYTCDNNQHAWPGGTVGPANDGSGYKLYLSPAPDISATVIAPDGTTSGPSDMSGVYFTSTTDYNGNQITSSNSGLTDTLGTIALEGSSYPSPTNPATYVGATGTYTSYTLRSNFGCAGVNEFVGQLPTSVITRITLADGSYYAFAYEPTPGYPGYITGRMASIRYPSGATVTYTYTGANYGINCNDGSTMGLTRVTPDGTWTYTRSGSSTTVVDPQGNQTIYDFATVQYASPWSYYTVSQAPLMEVRRRVYQGSGTLLKTVETCYNSAAFPCTGTSISLPVARRTVRTELPDSSGLVSELDTYYDTATYSLVTEVDEYDFGTGGPPPTPVRKTLTTYASFASNPNITNRPLTVTVQDGSGNVKSQTTYAYDETAVTPTTGTPQHVSVSGSRGNPTTITYLVQGSTTVHRTKTYFDTGTVNTETDFAGNSTTYAYGTSSCGNSFPTQVTLPLNHIKSATWDCNGGVLTSATDENSKTTSYIYGDPSFWRLTQVNYPDGGQITATYNQGTTSPWNIVQNKKITSSLTLSQKTVYDSLGRVSQQQLTSDPQGTVLTDTTYDSVGRVATVSNPYRSTGDPAYGITTYKYDALGRTCVVVPPDGTAISGSTCPTTQPANDLSTTYSANTTTVTDQAGKSRKSVTDGLGRLTQVFEDPASFNYETDYSYDTLNNLLTVNQKGGSTNSANWRTRTFSYNSLSQLLTAANPESGAVTYAYDANGNLLQKTSPAPNQTGSATVTLSYCYDVLNRLTAKGYTFSPNTPPTCSNGTLPSPVATYSYDQTNCLSQPSCFNVGRRTGMTDAAGSELWAYDSMGRPLADQRTTNGIMKPTTYTYNLDGSVATLAYPSGRVITYTPNAAGRTISAVDSTGPINYATAAAYAPTGALSSLTNGASLVSTFYFNNRVQPCRISVKNAGTAPASCTDAATGNVLDFSYCFNSNMSDADRAAHNCAASATLNNGNVAQIVNKQTTTRTQNFKYDSLNRIQSAYTESTTGQYCWDELFGYDPWSNLLTIGRISGYSCSNEELLNTSATTKNQVSGDTYDAAGNLIIIPAIASYTFDAENHLTSTAGVTYTYDGDGKRVQKSNGKLYWYGMGSDPLDETDLTGSTSNSGFKEYIFFGGKRIASRDYLNNVNYYFADHLGTARIVANSSGTPVDDSDFYPFGGERVYLNSSPQNYKFTGKERDSESGLDNFTARYFGSSLGRFMTPDWSAKPQGVPYAVLDDPQSLNLYAYVRNNPLNRTDPSGHYICTGSKAQCQAVADGLAQARAALKSENLTKDQRAALNKVVSTFGKAGDERDGVTISFGKTQSPRASAEAHSYKDENGLLRTDITFNSKTFGSLNTTQVGGELVHERSHGLDGIARGNMDPQNKNQEFRTELRAYGVESYVPKALNVPYPGLWNPNWAPDSADASRFTGVLSGAITSTSEWCREGGPGC